MEFNQNNDPNSVKQEFDDLFNLSSFGSGNDQNNQLNGNNNQFNNSLGHENNRNPNPNSNQYMNNSNQQQGMNMQFSDIQVTSQDYSKDFLNFEDNGHDSNTNSLQGQAFNNVNPWETSDSALNLMNQLLTKNDDPFGVPQHSIYNNSNDHNGVVENLSNVEFVNPFQDNASFGNTTSATNNNNEAFTQFSGFNNNEHNEASNVQLQQQQQQQQQQQRPQRRQLLAQASDSNLLAIPFGNDVLQRQGSSSNLSDLSSNANSPYFSAAASPFSANNDFNDALSINNENHTESNDFLHESISNNNGYLDSFGKSEVPNRSLGAQRTTSNTSDPNKLTVENLQNFHNSISSNSSTRQDQNNNNNDNVRNQKPPIIKYEHVEQQAAKTPSLFGSSNKSSPLNSPRRSRANSIENKSKYGNSLLPSVNITNMGSGDNAYMAQSTSDEHGNLSPNFTSPISSANDDELLHPNTSFESGGSRIGRPRRKSIGSKSPGSRSHSRSRSRSRSREKGMSLAENREKILELASPNHSNKRQQKHPSIYACDLCDKKFTRPYNLKSHKRTHTDERPFICSTCGKAFARQHDKKRHEDLHTGEKRFQCRGYLKDGKTIWGCGKKFARIDALGRHFRTEAGKECIKPLVQEAEREKTSNNITFFASGQGNIMDFYQQIMQHQQQVQKNAFMEQQSQPQPQPQSQPQPQPQRPQPVQQQSIPQLAISPPDIKINTLDAVMAQSHHNNNNHHANGDHNNGSYLNNNNGNMDMMYSPGASPIDSPIPDYEFTVVPDNNTNQQ